ncbi:beta-flanking protein [Lentinula aff. lateritia]|uniref:Beta-flanking protein n=1 Tax=Lentinula aff. lateritia TaxID=2804960 RepID=A0ACC1TGD0_9AGAR|nr:beta-flanking protein [Lentinula aff. lateritia]
MFVVSCLEYRRLLCFADPFNSHTIQPDVSKTGGSKYNSPDNRPQGVSRPSFNHDEVVQTAEQHGSGDSGMFSHAMSYVKNNTVGVCEFLSVRDPPTPTGRRGSYPGRSPYWMVEEHEEPIDEEHVTSSHQEAYERGNAGSLSAGSMGSAAALQIFKQFTSGSGRSGGSKSQLISMAMAEASKLFDQSGGAASGSKQDAVNGAGMMVMKMLVQSKMSSMMGGGNSGGLGGMSGMLGLVSKFM